MAISYKGAISFGLIYIPIALYTSVRSGGIRFNLVERNTLSRVKYKNLRRLRGQGSGTERHRKRV